MQIVLSQTVPETAAEVIFVTKDRQHGGLALQEPQLKFAEVTVWRGRTPVVFTVGLEAEQSLVVDQLRMAAGRVIREVIQEGLESVRVELPGLFSEETEVAAIVEGFLLGTYKFEKYKSETKPTALTHITIMAPSSLEGALLKAQIYAEATNLARNLANEPPNVLRPAVLAEFVKQHFHDTSVEVTVWDEERLVEEQMMGLLAVGKGSENKPRFIEIRYQTDSELPLVALVGKGLTFDSGGISLKSGRDISDMRMDMAGAAAVVGALDALIRLRADCNVVGLIAAAENLPDGGSMLPGELISYRNGVSVQVANTDAEGRLVLADALIRAKELGAKYMIDIATLTGAAASALGTKYAAVFGHDQVVAELQKAGNRTGDHLWPMPLPEEYNRQLKSVYADISNIGKGLGGAITAALFLKHFVDQDALWAHIDMAGPMEAEETEGYLPAGATGFGVRVLADYVLNQ